MENHVLLIQLFMEKYKNTKENETILAIGIAYFFKFQRFTQKELKGAISDLASSSPSIDSFRSLKCVHGHLSVNYKEGAV
jgi:hypothetical protein